MITITIANEGRLWPHYYYGPTTIRVTLASPNRALQPSRSCRQYEVSVIEGPKYPGPKRRSIVFGCKFNPHRNTARFLKALFARAGLFQTHLPASPKAQIPTTRGLPVRPEWRLVLEP